MDRSVDFNLLIAFIYKRPSRYGVNSGLQDVDSYEISCSTAAKGNLHHYLAQLRLPTPRNYNSRASTRLAC